MIRAKIKKNELRFRAVIELIERGYETIISNKNGDCLFIWTNGQKKCEISHWTNDNPIMHVDDENFRWLINCLD